MWTVCNVLSFCDWFWQNRSLKFFFKFEVWKAFHKYKFKWRFYRITYIIKSYISQQYESSTHTCQSDDDLYSSYLGWNLLKRHLRTAVFTVMVYCNWSTRSDTEPVLRTAYQDPLYIDLSSVLGTWGCMMVGGCARFLENTILSSLKVQWLMVAVCAVKWLMVPVCAVWRHKVMGNSCYGCVVTLQL